MKNTIAICGANLNDVFQTDTLHAIIKKANALGYDTKSYYAINDLEEDSPKKKGEISVYELIDYDSLSGLIIFCERIKDVNVCKKIIDTAKRKSIPVVSIDYYWEGCYNVRFDYGNTFREIVEHVVDVHNCRKIYVMGGMKDNSFSDERIEVVRDVLHLRGIPLEEDYIGYGDFWSKPCLRTIREFLDSDKEMPDAIIAVNDAMAIAICDELKFRGYSIPKDVIVTGFDGIYTERFASPRLTTAAQNNELAGERAVEIISKVSKRGELSEPYDVKIPFKVRFSQSCGCRKFVKYKYMEQLKYLSLRMDGNELFSHFMDDMTEKMTLKKNITNIADNIIRYNGFLEDFEHQFICVKRDFFKNDEVFYNSVASLSSAAESEGDMVLFNVKCGMESYNPCVVFPGSQVIPEEYLDEHCSNLIFVPLNLHDEVFGYVVSTIDNEYANLNKIIQYAATLSLIFSSVKQDLRMMKAFKELSEVKSELEKLYIKDALTGVYNRRGFYQQLPKLLSGRNKGALSLISTDMDALKYINDTFGHTEGDYAIQLLAEAMTKIIADNGIVARFGGDEFVAVYLSNDTNDRDVFGFCEKMNKYMAQKVKADEKPYPVVCSMGFVVRQLPFGGDIEDLIILSDQKMYDMKKLHHDSEGK